MFMNIKKSTPVVIVMVSLVLGAGGLIFYKRKPNVDGTAKVIPTADLQKEFLAKTQSRLNSPVGKAWLAQDFTSLGKMFGTHLTAKGNLDFFQTTGYIWDTQPMKLSADKESALGAFESQIVDFILSSEKSNSVMVSHYALRAMKKMPSLCLECPKRIAEAYAKTKERGRKDQYFEYLLSTQSPPDFIKKELFELAKKDEQLRTVFSHIPEITDKALQKEIANSIYKRLKKMSPAGQAIALKFFVYNRNLIQADLTDEVKLVSTRDDDLSQDAFLNSVQQLKLEDQYKSRIAEIAKNSVHIHIRSFAKALLQ